MRIFTATLATETNTFAPLPSGLKAWKEERGYYPAGTHPDRMTLFAGPLWALLEAAPARGWTVVEGMVAFAQPGGTTTRAAWDALREELLADLRAALPVRMVLLGLHGAMVADGCDDCEGELLRQVRAIVGPDVVVGAELDPHHHLTPAMVDNADLLIAFKEYPHTDVLERGRELVALCAATAEGGIRPRPYVADPKMITMIHTTRQPTRGFVDRLMALEGRDGVLSISVAHGFPWGDVADMGTRVLVYTDANAADATDGATLAKRLADELAAMRDDLGARLLPVDEALDLAVVDARAAAAAATPGQPCRPVVLADGADNAGGGAASDSTWILQRLIARGLSAIGGIALGPLWDPQAVRIAHEAGLGATLPLRVGGKVGPLSGAPVDLQATVMGLSERHIMTGLSNTPTNLGATAWVRAGGIDIVLISIRNQAIGLDLFTALGLNPSSCAILVLKSSQHFRAAFGPVAHSVIYVDAPGTVTGDLLSLPYRKARRDIWPFNGAGAPA
ncbi:MAG: M81 family metallopeptidase [Aquabacterium sp.]